MAMKYANKLIPGDNVIVADSDIQTVTKIEPSGHRNVSIKFESGHLMIIGATTHLPVMKSKFDDELSIEDVYNLVLDDKMSLSEFSLWCSSNRG